MHRVDSIRSVENIFQGRRIDLPEDPGVYAFWWTGSRRELLRSNRHIVLTGPSKRPVDVKFMEWWPPEIGYPCLYVGKSTNIKKRFSQHIKRRCKDRLHEIHKTNKKGKAVTTTCQLRYGIEHIFKDHNNPLSIIYRNYVAPAQRLFTT